MFVEKKEAIMLDLRSTPQSRNSVGAEYLQNVYRKRPTHETKPTSFISSQFHLSSFMFAKSVITNFASTGQWSVHNVLNMSDTGFHLLIFGKKHFGTYSVKGFWCVQEDAFSTGH